MSLHPLFELITRPLNEPDPMSPLRDYYRESLAKIEAEKSIKRINRQTMLESELVEFRPDEFAAAELVSALKTGLEARIGDLPVEVEYAFNDLKKLLESA